MKKWLVPVIVTAVVFLGGCVASIVLLNNSAQNLQAQQHEYYETMVQNAARMTLSVVEQGEISAQCGLEELGVLDQTMAALDGSVHDYVRMEPDAFAQMPLFARLKWRLGGSQVPETLAVQSAHLDLQPLMTQLDAVKRQAPVDACMVFEDGRFRLEEEVPGTLLQKDAVEAALTQAVEALAVSQQPASAVVDLDAQGGYVLPEKTVSNTNFDYAQGLADALKTMTVTIDFQGKTETLASGELESLLQVKDDGLVQVNRKQLEELVAHWHETYRNDGVPYLFHAQVGGVKPIDFLLVDYELNRDATADAVEEALLQLESAELEAQWYCWRKGEAFAIEGEYVEVDIPNQKMTYVKDGEVLVSTDVVTGASWGFPTPPGLYKVENKDTDCWLSGEDYNVFVDYWIGFIGFDYGIHDADWRTIFGGIKYKTDGSHGCVNTPKEATEIIFNNIEVGVPVLVYGK